MGRIDNDAALLYVIKLSLMHLVEVKCHVSLTVF